MLPVWIDAKKVEKLRSGVIPIYEPGLESIVQRSVYYKRLQFTTDIQQSVAGGAGGYFPSI
jgi:UDPglucose 6-dehydrogenase